MAQPIEIDVWQGEIAELEVDAVVVAASESLFMTAGAATAVKRRAGADVERAAVEQGPIPPTLESAVRAALAFAVPLQLRRVAVAPLGIEHGVFAAEEAAAVLIPAIIDAARDTPIESVVLAASHASEVQALSDALRAARAGASLS
jgi:O-acetyl-ADP-ribose deacetylase (regulator of RNase III)